MNEKRLLKLADFLEKKVPAEHFCMTFWMGEDKNGHKHERASIECGTPACAAGWATAIFPELVYSVRQNLIRLKGQRYTKTQFADSTLNHLMQFFGLTMGQADYVFGGEISRTPTEEAVAIRLLIENNGDVPEDDDEY